MHCGIDAVGLDRMSLRPMNTTTEAAECITLLTLTVPKLVLLLKVGLIIYHSMRVCTVLRIHSFVRSFVHLFSSTRICINKCNNVGGRT